MGIHDPEVPLPSRLDPDVYTTLTVEEIRQLLLNAGFDDVAVHTNPDVSRDTLWVVATADRDR